MYPGVGQAGRHFEARIPAPLTGDEQVPVSPDSVYIDRSLDGAAESEEGKMDSLEDRGGEELPPACLTPAAAINWQAAVPLPNAIKKAPDEDASEPVGGSCMPVNQSLLETNRLFEEHDGMPLTPRLLPAGAGLILSPEGRGKGEGAEQGMAPSAEGSMEIPEAATYANGEETSAFDVRSFKDAGANAPDMPVRPETSMSLDALSTRISGRRCEVNADAQGMKQWQAALSVKPEILP